MSNFSSIFFFSHQDRPEGHSSQDEVPGPRPSNQALAAECHDNTESGPADANQAPVEINERGEETATPDFGSGVHVSNLELLHAMGQIERNMMSYIQDLDSQISAVKK